MLGALLVGSGEGVAGLLGACVAIAVAPGGEAVLFAGAACSGAGDLFTMGTGTEPTMTPSVGAFREAIAFRSAMLVSGKKKILS